MTYLVGTLQHALAKLDEEIKTKHIGIDHRFKTQRKPKSQTAQEIHSGLAVGHPVQSQTICSKVMRCISDAQTRFQRLAQQDLIPDKGISFTFVFDGNSKQPTVVGTSDSHTKSSDVESKLGFKYHVYHTSESSYQTNLHSEIDAILKLKSIAKSKHGTWLKHKQSVDESSAARQFDASKYVFINVRLNSKGGYENMSSSGPCDNCMHALNIVGYDHIYYHANVDGSFQIMEIDKIASQNI